SFRPDSFGRFSGARGASMEHRTKTILVNCFPDDYPQIWETLADCSVEIEAEFADARSAIDTVRLSQNEERLCIVHITGPDQVQQRGWLSEGSIGRPVMALVDGGSARDLVFAVNRAGAAQVLPLPLQADDLRAALHSLRLRHAPPQPVAARRVVAVS